MSSVRLDNSSASLSRSDAPNSAVFTVCVWAKIVTNRNDSSGIITGDNFYYVGTLGSDGVTLELYTNQDNTGSTLSVGTWYHIAVTRSTGSWVVYLNGVSNVTYTDFGPLITNLFFGTSPGGDWLNGSLRGARAWTLVALSASEIVSEMNSTTPVRTSGLWGAWDMADASTAATDSSGNSRDLTIASLNTDSSNPSIYNTSSASDIAGTLNRRRTNNSILVR